MPQLNIHLADSAASSTGDAAGAAPAADSGRPLPVEPLLVGAAAAGRLCGRSEASWWRDHAARRVPAPIKLGGRTLWRVADLRRWVEAGCPSRREWEALNRINRR